VERREWDTSPRGYRRKRKRKKDLSDGNKTFRVAEALGGFLRSRRPEATDVSLHRAWKKPGRKKKLQNS